MKACKYCGTSCDDTTSLCPSCGANEFRHQCANCGTLFDNAAYCPTCGVKIGSKAKICPDCGTSYFSAACPNCGYCAARARQPVTQVIYQTQVPYRKQCSKWISLILCFFLGYLGAHKFYEGKSGIGFLYLLTLGLFGIGWIVDTISLLFKADPYYV